MVEAKMAATQQRKRATNSAQPLDVVVRRHRSMSDHGDADHGWAVSYSDLLMVLMSFFIIFFSFDNSKKSVIDQITMSLADTGFKAGIEGSSGPTPPPTKAASGTGNGTGTGNDVDTGRPVREVLFPKLGLPATEEAILNLSTPDLAAALFNTASGMGVDAQLESNKESLILHLPPNIYKPGKFALEPDQRQVLDELLIKLKPAASRVTFAFIGHSDADLVKVAHTTYSDNFMLSSLRAWNGMMAAAKLGYPPIGMTILGAADQMVVSRTLSIKITPKDQHP